jgi:hypothetical protein
MTAERIKAKETWYKGVKFRSRTEARWAVFFDHLGIPWQHEPRRYDLPYRLDNPAQTRWYLPDFWLPSLGMWAEVKGKLNDYADYALLLNRAAALSSPAGGCGGGNDTVVLGDNPYDLDAASYPYRLHMHGENLYAIAWPRYGTSHCWDPNPDLVDATTLGNLRDGVRTGEFAERWSRILTGQLPTVHKVLSPYHRDFTADDRLFYNGLVAAKEARFDDHGSGAT